MGEIQLEMMMSRLGVGDIDAACEFWCAIGLRELWRWPEDGETQAAGLGGGPLQMVVVRAEGAIDRQQIVVHLRGVEAMHARCAGVHPGQTSELVDQAWGLRQFDVCDPWGHRVTFGEAIGGGG